MVKILAILLYLQEETVDKVKDIIEEDIWGTIKEWLSFELISLGKEPNHIGFTVGHLIVLIIAFILTSIVLKWVRVLMTRRMEGDDKLKFVSVFKFIKYIAYIVVVLATMSASGIDITVLLTASAALFVGLGLALQEVFQDVIGGILNQFRQVILLRWMVV